MALYSSSTLSSSKNKHKISKTVFKLISIEYCAAPRCPATLPLILNGHEGQHHLWHLRDPAPGLGKNSLTSVDNLFIHQSSPNAVQ